MKKCSDKEFECVVACDYCKHYDFNGQMEIDDEGKKYNVYTGDGWCRLYKRQRDPEEGDGCEGFHCFTLPDEPSPHSHPVHTDV